MNHTKEPWHATQNPEWGNANYRISNKETDEWANFGQIAYANEADAKRIVACVNACADVDDDRLSLGYVKGLEVENAQLKAQLTWRPASELPKEDQIVIATYLNSYGKRRRVRAVYIRQYEEELDYDDDSDYEYNEENDTYYLKEGWYELIDNWSDYSSVAVCEGEVDYWMQMPEFKKEQE